MASGGLGGEFGGEAVEGVEGDDGGHLLLVVEGPVDRGGAGGVVRHEHHPFQAEAGHDSVEVARLVGEGVVVISGLVRLAPTEEVEGHDVSFGQMRDQSVVEVVVVGEAVHQHDGGSLAGLFSCVQAVLAPFDPAVLEASGHTNSLPQQEEVGAPP
jgi:hypothetical protein